MHRVKSQQAGEVEKLAGLGFGSPFSGKQSPYVQGSFRLKGRLARAAGGSQGCGLKDGFPLSGPWPPGF